MLLFLPIVGLEIGIIWAGLAWLCRWLAVPKLMSALVLSAWPWIGTGFLHLDGYMDVTDAVKSYRSLERRREILKDSHVGSFAVIGIVLLILAQFAAFASVPEGCDLRILILVPAVSRCCSALAVTGFLPCPPANMRTVRSRRVTCWYWRSCWFFSYCWALCSAAEMGSFYLAF